MFDKARRRWLVVVVLAACLAGSAFAEGQYQPERSGIIAFLTDWGTRDFYIGAVKGVALSIFPEATLVDITHEVEPYSIMEGAVTLWLAAREFPAGTVFVAVVDPGVGTERRPIVVQTLDDKFFVGPDNGLFTFVMQEFGVKGIYEITDESFMRPAPRSYTFHGRDVFTPAATHIAMGRRASEVGPTVEYPISLAVEPARYEDDMVVGQVILVDQYGNMQVNITRGLLEHLGLRFGDRVYVQVGEKRIESTFVNTYGDVPEGHDLVFIASTDLVEISVNMGSARERLGGEIGSLVIIEKAG